MNQQIGDEKSLGESLEEKLMTTQQVADWIGFTPQHITRLCRARQIPHYRIARTYRFQRHEVLVWLRQAAVTGAEEHRHGRKESEWDLPRQLHVSRPEDEDDEALSPFSWDERQA